MRSRAGLRTTPGGGTVSIPEGKERVPVLRGLTRSVEMLASVLTEVRSHRKISSRERMCSCPPLKQKILLAAALTADERE